MTDNNSISDPIHKHIVEWASWHQYHKDTPMDVIQRIKFLERSLDGFMTGVLMLNEARMKDKNLDVSQATYNLINPEGGKFQINDEAIR